MRTSISHPLEIASVRPAPGFGRVGITFCPGKQQPSALTGSWQRDLKLDVEAIADFGAAAVVTLIEDHEFEELAVRGLGDEVRRQHMEWVHLPIADMGTPSSAFERRWCEASPGLHARLRDGFDVVVHCKGGLGRAGTIAARLLVELGMSPTHAIAQVRDVRPGALETQEQMQYVHRLPGPVAGPTPRTDDEAIRDRAVGALLGLAVGDALGTTLEFKGRDTYPPLTDIVGGGPFSLKPGQWTDDTAMALALAESLAHCDPFSPTDLMHRFVAWRREGEYSCTGSCFDIGVTTSAALGRFERTGDPFAGSIDPQTAGNGSLMRLAPVAIRYWRDHSILRQVAIDQSRTTHGAPEAVSACAAYAGMLADAIAGVPREGVLSQQSDGYAGSVAKVVRGSWRGKARTSVRSGGYVVESLEAALWAIGRTSDFRGAVLTAANLGDDADTTAAIAGQLAGALYGADAIPREWLEKLAWRERLEKLAATLFDCSMTPD
ncbi:ADP-ribosylglycohydrolase family protein [Novosphingobium aquae]|uniref:ADP-ribosylglycohydrolase family protein n=1 Tax=Novosphingobium aquae TaxID=3133435 RepID=A0ABU8S9K7_9SPHN